MCTVRIRTDGTDGTCVAQVTTRACTEAWDLDGACGWVESGGAMAQQGPYRHGWSVLATTRDQGVIRVQAATKGHVWVPGPVAARVWIDIHGSCCHQVP